MTVAPPPKAYLPWVRTGNARLITQTDTFAAGVPARATLRANLTLNGQAVTTAVQVYGPGDVVGLDAGSVLRTEPPDGASNFRPSHFPAVEFARPDLPWLFTPAKADGQDRLRPWMCLVAVRKRDPIAIVSPGDGPLPVITNVPVAELPSLDQAWAWAHAEALILPEMIAGLTKNQLTTFLHAAPAAGLSRLLCPTRLQPRATYYACVVPVFEIGRQAGLGRTIDDHNLPSLGPAWGKDGTVDLPVYYHWTFSTGDEDTAFALFEQLFSRLHIRQEMPAGVGMRTVEVGMPGYGLPSAPGTLRLLGSVFRARHCSPSPPSTVDTPYIFRDALRLRLNAEAPALTLRSDGRNTPVLAPPIYGHNYTGQRRLDPDQVVWLQELNLDPVYRIAAGLGTQVIQKRQEQFVADAWEQAGELRRAQQRLRQAQFAQSVGVSIMQRHLQPLEPPTFIRVTAPVHARVTMSPDTLYNQLEKSHEQATVLPAYRRLQRERGPVQRRLHTVQPMARGQQMLAPPPMQPMAAITPTAEHISAMVHTADVSLASSDPFSVAFANATRDLFVSYIDHWQIPTPEIITPLNAKQAKPILLQRLNPNVTVPRRAVRLTRGDELVSDGEIQIPAHAVNPADQLEPLPLTPAFPQAMVHELLALSTDWLLAGLNQIAPDSIAALETDPRFIEAFMVGLNHEMARELLWRGFPVDLQGTYFRRFWDPTAATSNTPGMPEIKAWNPAAHLGDSFRTGGTTVGAGGQVVLVLRGELVRRYPEAIIHMVQAEWEPGKRYRRPLGSPAPDQDRYPILRFDRSPDMSFLMFDVGEQDARGSRDPAQHKPGWCFLFQQPPVKPFFGHEATESVDLTALEAEIQARQGAGTPVNAANIAKAVVRESLRVAIHADSLLPSCG